MQQQQPSGYTPFQSIYPQQPPPASKRERFQLFVGPPIESVVEQFERVTIGGDPRRPTLSARHAVDLFQLEGQCRTQYKKSLERALSWWRNSMRADTSCLIANTLVPILAMVQYHIDDTVTFDSVDAVLVAIIIALLLLSMGTVVVLARYAFSLDMQDQLTAKDEPFYRLACAPESYFNRWMALRILLMILYTFATMPREARIGVMIATGERSCMDLFDWAILMLILVSFLPVYTYGRFSSHHDYCSALAEGLHPWQALLSRWTKEDDV